MKCAVTVAASEIPKGRNSHSILVKRNTVSFHNITSFQGHIIVPPLSLLGHNLARCERDSHRHRTGGQKLSSCFI